VPFALYGLLFTMVILFRAGPAASAAAARAPASHSPLSSPTHH
jgi:hypothetical protein